MTLSSAQRGDPVEGWNDCPPMMMNANSSTASVNKSKKRAQRVGHNINSSSSTSLLGLGSALLMGATPSRTELPPGPLKLLSEGVLPTSPLASNAQTGAVGGDAPADVQLLLETLFLAKSLLLDREHAHYVKKLKDANSTVDAKHKTFLVSVLDKVSSAVGAKAADQIPVIKGDVVQYMIVNDGVSGWCIPLRKIVESLNVE